MLLGKRVKLRRRIVILIGIPLLCLLWISWCQIGTQRVGLISCSPGAEYRAVEIIPSSLLDRSMEFRVFDWRASWQVSEAICDLNDMGSSTPMELHWSRDGSVAAVMMQMEDRSDRLYGAAYDFHEHRSILPGFQGTRRKPTDISSQAISERFAKRGGVAKIVSIP